VGKVSKLSLADMKALLPPAPVLANESQEQFEKFFDQVQITLQIQDMVEMILVRDFVLPSWEIARYTLHRVVALDRKFKGELQQQVSHLQDKQARRAAFAQRLVVYLGLRPWEVSQLIELGGQVLADVEIAEVLKHAPSELPYNRALEGNIDFHKDLEFLITNMTKRRDQALETLERYRQGLGRRVKDVTEEIVNAEYEVVENPSPESQAAEDQLAQLALPLTPLAEPPAENEPVQDHAATSGSNQPQLTPVPGSALVDDGNGSDD
jgi:hypothetical protein